MSDLQPYIDDIAKYDDTVNEELIAVLYKSLAGVLGNPDAANVACSDESELETVKKNFIEKKLEITDDAKADEAIKAVCEMMKDDRTKNRLTFYYLLTQELRCIGKMTEGA
jgi:hypothetical protein